MKQILSSRYSNEDDYEQFYELCGKDSQSLIIQNLLLKLNLGEKLNSKDLSYGLMGELRSNQEEKALSYGLIGALRNGQEENMATIIDFMNKNNIKTDIISLVNAILIKREPIENTEIVINFLERGDIDSKQHNEQLNMLFNHATLSNNVELSNKLDEKYFVLKNAVTNQIDKKISLVNGESSIWAELEEDGSVQISGFDGFGGQQTNEERVRFKYNKNPIIFNLDELDLKLVDSFFNKGYEINPSLIIHGLVKNIYLGKTEAILYLLTNEKCMEVIKNSNEIKDFINSDANWVDEKKEARKILSLVELEDKLQGLPNNNSIKNRAKI